MATQCAICGKQGTMVGRRIKLRGRYNPTSKKRKRPNLQWVKLPSGIRVQRGGKKRFISSPKRVKACAKCIKAMGKRNG